VVLPPRARLDPLGRRGRTGASRTHGRGGRWCRSAADHLVVRGPDEARSCPARHHAGPRPYVPCVEALDVRQAHRAHVVGLSRFAAAVVHDLNNLLAVIFNYVVLARSDVAAVAGEPGGERWAGVRRDLDSAMEAAHRSEALIRRLALFAGSPGRLPPIIDVDREVGSAETLLASAAGEGVRIVVQGAANPATVAVDPDELHHVLRELAVNAREAMDGAGTLTVATDTLDDPDGSLVVGSERVVRIRASDTGPGVPLDAILDAAVPFVTTKPRRDGSGLGLAIVDSVVSRAGGTVRISAEAGRGATVELLFPALEAAGEPTAEVH